MVNKLIQHLMMAMVIIPLSAPFALAETQYIYGKVKRVDIQNGTLVIVTEADETKTFWVPKSMLKGVKPGDEVDIEVTDGKVTEVATITDES